MTRSLRWDAEVDGLSALPIRVRRQPTWQVDETRNLVALQMDRAGGTSWMRPRILPVLENLVDGVTLPELVGAVEETEPARSRADIARSVRALVNGLVEQGNLHVALPETQEVFGGRFRVVRELGRGGVGVAWLCDDVEHPDGDPVVVKHAWNWSGPFEKRDASLRAEGNVLARLDHPGVTRLVARFDVDGRHHVARAFAPGEDLLRRTLRHGAPGRAERRRMLAEVAEVVAHVHERGFLCLDLNPANFLLQGDGRVMLADVGHARRLDDPVKGRWGVDGYTAPDLARGGAAYSVRADVYGLGALAWFLATGKPPTRFKGDATAWPDGVDGAERRFLLATLAPAAADRPATVTDAMRILDGA